MERTLSVQERTQDKQTTDNSETGREMEALRMRFPYLEEEIVLWFRGSTFYPTPPIPKNLRNKGTLQSVDKYALFPKDALAYS